MILLPIFYVALVISVGGGVYWHATENLTIITAGKSGAMLRGLAYLAPLFAGTIGLIFLTKPLVAPRGKPRHPYSLDRASQPFLFTFVERLCDTVGAPHPERIDVDLRANASASLRRGFRSFLGQDLVLTIGLPLAAGISVRQLAGILAHEFGHFTQGGGMRLGFVVHRIHRWFARVVYERDAWDERLERWREESSSWQGNLVLACTQGFVWLSRKVLWLLMQVGLLLSAFLSRQMEYDADRYEARLSGCDAFEKSMVDLARLGLAEHWAMSDLSQAARAQKLVDDLPHLILANLDQIDARPGLAEQLREDALGGEHHPLSTHPAHRDRIAMVRRENSSGIFTVEAPGTIVFDDFPALCRAATRHHYTHQIAIDLAIYELVPATVLAERQRIRSTRLHQVVTHFGGVLPTPLQIFTMGGKSREAARAARTRVRAMAKEAAAQQDRLQELYEEADSIQAMLSIRRIDPESDVPLAEITARRDSLQKSIAVQTAALVSWRECAVESLYAVVQREETAQRNNQAHCGEALLAMADIWEDRRTLEARLHEFLALLENEPGNRAALERKRHSTACKIYELLGGIHERLEGIAHPFRDEDQGDDLVSDILPTVPRTQDVSDLIVATQRAIERSGSLSIEFLAPFVPDDEPEPGSGERA